MDLYSVNKEEFKRAGIDLEANEYTVVVNFRGTWWPPCRVQLRELEEAKRSGNFSGVGLHVVTAEPGGDNEIKARLKARNLVLSIEVHSDPNHKLLLRMKDSPDKEAPVYVKMVMECKQFNSETSIPYEAYNMVQPALVVIHKSGNIQQAFSWKLGSLKDITPKEWNTPVAAYGGMLVGIRPVSSDIADSIKQNRDVKLKFQGMDKIKREMDGPPPMVSIPVVVGSLIVAVTLFKTLTKIIQKQ